MALLLSSRSDQIIAAQRQGRDVSDRNIMVIMDCWSCQQLSKIEISALCAAVKKTVISTSWHRCLLMCASAQSCWQYFRPTCWPCKRSWVISIMFRTAPIVIRSFIKSLALGRSRRSSVNGITWKSSVWARRIKQGLTALFLPSKFHMRSGV